MVNEHFHVAQNTCFFPTNTINSKAQTWTLDLFERIYTYFRLNYKILLLCARAPNVTFDVSAQYIMCIYPLYCSITLNGRVYFTHLIYFVCSPFDVVLYWTSELDFGTWRRRKNSQWESFTANTLLMATDNVAEWLKTSIKKLARQRRHQINFETAISLNFL